MINPIDGAYYHPETLTYTPQPLSFAVGMLSEGLGRGASEVTGETLYLARGSVAAGQPVEDSATLALEAGDPAEGVARQASVVTGLLRPTRGSGMGLTVAPAASVFAARISQDVITSRIASAAARMSLVATGVSRGRHFPHFMTVRQELVQRAGQSATVRSYVESLTRMALSTGIEHALVSRVSADIVSGDGFVVLADIVGQTLYDTGDVTPVGYYPMQDINARLYVGGVEVPIRSFTYQEPKGRLGASLNVVLAEASRTLAPVNSSITFQLVVVDADENEHVVTLVSNGKIGGRSYTIQFLNDELTIAGLNTLADKFSLAPRRPIVMFDPEFNNVDEIGGSARDAVRTEKGTPILPSLEPVSGLSVHTALRRIYTGASGYQFMTRVQPNTRSGWSSRTESLLGVGAFDKGLDFADVITNIPDYRVARVDISLESTWHGAAAPLFGMYGPIYFVQSNVLFVIDSQRTLPAGHAPRTIPLSKYSVMAHSQPYRDPTNAVLLVYQERGSDAADAWAYREQTETTISEDGKFGSIGFTRTETRVTTREKYLLDEPDNVLEVVELSNDVRVYTQLARIMVIPTQEGEYRYDSEPGEIMQTSREVTQTRYNSEGLKSGHHKEIYGLILAGPFGDPNVIKLAHEDCTITWEQHPSDPSQMIQTRNFTLYEGLIYEGERTESRLDPSTGQNVDVRVRYPVLAANSSPGIFRENGEMFYGPVKSLTEELRRVRGGQLDVVVREKDLAWSGTVRESHTAPRTGSRSVNPYEARSRTILVRDLASEAEIGPRVPASISAGELPRDRAIELAQRALRQGVMGQPPEPTFQIPGVDFAALQGSVVKGEFRDGTLTEAMIVEGRTITGSNLGQQGHRISMALEGTELA